MVVIPVQVANENGEGGSHKNCGQTEQGKSHQGDAEERTVRSGIGDPLYQVQAGDAKAASGHFADDKQLRQMGRKSFGQDSTHQRAYSQSQHENGDDNSHRLDIHPIGCKQYPLPDDLVDKSRNARQ